MTTNQVGTLHSANGLGFGLGFEIDGSLRRKRHGLSRLVRLGRSVWFVLSRGSEDGDGRRDDDQHAAEHDRHRRTIQRARLSGACRRTVEVTGRDRALRAEETVFDAQHFARSWRMVYQRVTVLLSTTKT